MQLGQKIAFLVDASRIARLPLTTDYFPEMRGNVVPASGRDPDFVARVEARLKDLTANGFEITKIDAVVGNTK